MKKILKGLIVTSLLLCVPTSVFAETSFEKDGVISVTEKQILLNKVGLSETSIELLPASELELLLEEDAVLIGKGEEKSFDLKSETPEVQVMKITSNDIKLSGYGFAVPTDRPGYKKIKLVATYDWNIDPLNKWTDTISIGYPQTNKFFLPFNSNGQVEQFYSLYSAWSPTYEQWDDYASIVPTDWDNGAGIGESINIKAGRDAHQGYIRMHAYVKNTETGTSNVKIRYGHAILNASPSFSVYTAGLSVEPKMNVETLDFGFVLSW
jgi:hypothetical protein